MEGGGLARGWRGQGGAGTDEGRGGWVRVRQAAAVGGNGGRRERGGCSRYPAGCKQCGPPPLPRWYVSLPWGARARAARLERTAAPKGDPPPQPCPPAQLQLQLHLPLPPPAHLHIMAALRTMASGFATSCPAMSGAEPCTWKAGRQAAPSKVARRAGGREWGQVSAPAHMDGVDGERVGGGGRGSGGEGDD